MKRRASDTVEAWIRMGKNLQPNKLIPALIQCNQPVESAQVRGCGQIGVSCNQGNGCLQVSAAIRYLEFCVNDLRNKERAIHNFLISSYATGKEDGSYSKLISYLIKQVHTIVCVYVCMYVCMYSETCCPYVHVIMSHACHMTCHMYMSCLSHAVWWPTLLRHTVCLEAVYGEGSEGGMCSYLWCHGFV